MNNDPKYGLRLISMTTQSQISLTIRNIEVDIYRVINRYDRSGNSEIQFFLENYYFYNLSKIYQGFLQSLYGHIVYINHNAAWGITYNQHS